MTWPDTDLAIVRQFLRQLQLRPASVKTYQPMLAEFQQFVVEHSPDQSVSRLVLEKWLYHRSTFSATHTIMQRVWPIDHFLIWLADRRLINSNPLEDLRKDLVMSDTAQIIRALLSSDSAAALEALRPEPRFASQLGPVMRDYVVLKQSLGFRYRTEELQLLRLDRFLQERSDLATRPVAEIVNEWTEENPTPEHRLECILTGRILARALQRTSPAVIAPRMDRRLNHQVRRRQRRPHIYSESDVSLLLTAALSFPSPRTPERPRMLYTMIVLGYCVGLRFGEIVHLTLGDIDLTGQTIEIRETKFFKSRQLPVTTTVNKALADYLEARRLRGAPTESSAPLFWYTRRARGYRYPTVHALLVQVIRRAGLKPGSGAVGPRIHDLRHSFVVNRILAWYREGINPQERLPYLFTYLGHKDLHSTLTYIYNDHPGTATTRQRSIPHVWVARYSRRDRRGSMQLVSTLPQLLHSFFQDWLVQQRSMSSHTVVSYRDTWRLFLRFVAEARQRPVAKITIDQITAKEVLAFLEHCEKDRRVSIGTRNCRLAAIRSFFSFVAGGEPLLASQCAAILRIPTKRAPRRTIRSMEVEEIEAILAQPNRTSLEGQRDHALLALLYNTGARIQEALNVRPQDIRFERPAGVRIIGKGQKERHCPLWPESAALLKALLKQKPREKQERIFVNRYGEPLGASGVRYKLRAYVAAAVKQAPSLSLKSVSPHLFRHSTACHLLASGVDITVVRDVLGHAHLDTTSHYAQSNLETKRKALEKVAARPAKPPRWRRDQDLLAWLDSL